MRRGVRLAGILLSATASLLFVVVHCYGIWLAWRPAAGPGASQMVLLETIATSLTGLLGGVIAMAFGVPEPSAERTRRLARLAWFADRRNDAPGAHAWLVWTYIGAYFLVGLGAGVAHLFAPAAPDFTKSLALVAVGLLIAIANHEVRRQV